MSLLVICLLNFDGWERKQKDRLIVLKPFTASEYEFDRNDNCK